MNVCHLWIPTLSSYKPFVPPLSYKLLQLLFSCMVVWVPAEPSDVSLSIGVPDIACVMQFLAYTSLLLLRIFYSLTMLQGVWWYYSEAFWPWLVSFQDPPSDRERTIEEGLGDNPVHIREKESLDDNPVHIYPGGMLWLHNNWTIARLLQYRITHRNVYHQRKHYANIAL